MKDRITEKMLERIVDLINKELDRPAAPWKRNADGKLTANIGNFHLSSAYGGKSLHEMASEGGGVHDVFSCGHIPKRELASKMRAFLDGIAYAKGRR